VQFSVEPAIFERFPGLRLAVVVAQGVDNEADRPAVAARWRAAWAGAGEVAARYANAQSHPRVVPWRERFRAMGVPAREFPSSIEALLRRALKGGEPFSVNPLVDFYNALSLAHTVPVGGFDLDQLQEPIALRLTRPGDRFAVLDGAAPVDVPADEVAYAAGPTILTRQFVWRQSRSGAIAPVTRSVFLVAEVLGELEDGVAETVLGELDAGLRANFGVAPRAFLLDGRRPAISW
jgi:DNA/RNA-binding domain of Phe-tRNA-synthetase-like protein